MFQPKKSSINSFPDTYQVDGRADYKSCIYQHRRSISIYRALAYSYQIHRDKYKTQHLSLDLESKRETNFHTNIERKYSQTGFHGIDVNINLCRLCINSLQYPNTNVCEQVCVFHIITSLTIVMGSGSRENLTNW